MELPWSCHAFAMHSPMQFAMRLPCSCHDVAMQCHAVAYVCLMSISLAGRRGTSMTVMVVA